MEGLEFIQEPADDYLCIICAKILNEPHLTDCCGQHFCQVCLEQWFKKQAKKMCPHCRSESFTYIRSLPLKRKIDSLQVYCSNRSIGCHEIVMLCEHESHGNKCDYALVICSQGCDKMVLRRALKEHCTNFCLKRMIRCKYCSKEYCFEIAGEHMNNCEEYPISCPKGCDQKLTIKRKDLSAHAETCPLEQVRCPFYNAGCQTDILRKDFGDHMECNLQQHLLKMMAAYSNLEIKYNKLSDEHKKLSMKVASLTPTDGTSTSADSLCTGQAVCTAPAASPVVATKAIILSMENDNFSFEPTAGDLEWKSPDFYVPGGYKMCFIRKGRVVRLYLLKGEQDDTLVWPMHCAYNLEIMFTNNHTKRCRSQRFDLMHIECIPNRVTIEPYRELDRMKVPLLELSSVKVGLKLP